MAWGQSLRRSLSIKPRMVFEPGPPRLEPSITPLFWVPVMTRKYLATYSEIWKYQCTFIFTANATSSELPVIHSVETVEKKIIWAVIIKVSKNVKNYILHFPFQPERNHDFNHYLFGGTSNCKNSNIRKPSPLDYLGCWHWANNLKHHHAKQNMATLVWQWRQKQMEM